MLDIENNQKQIFKYLKISIFFLIFGLIYEFFSHNVYSLYMLGAFLIPLILGFGIYLIIYCTKIYKYLSYQGMQIFNCGVMTLTVGSVMKGVLEIYGTTNSLTRIYLIFSLILLIMSMVVNIIFNLKKKEGMDK